MAEKQSSIPRIPQSAIDAKIAEQAAEDSIGLQSAATPFPGATRKAFALCPDIEVGPYKVRPFYDYDIELLGELNHPLHKVIIASMAGKKDSGDEFIPRGKEAWELCWIMTRPIEETDAALEKGGIKEISSEAKKTFRKTQFGDLAAIVEVVLKQMEIYWSPVLGYGPKIEGEKSENPQSPKP